MNIFMKIAITLLVLALILLVSASVLEISGFIQLANIVGYTGVSLLGSELFVGAGLFLWFIWTEE